MKECVEVGECSNSFNGADVKAELEFIYSSLEQLGKAALEGQGQKDTEAS